MDVDELEGASANPGRPLRVDSSELMMERGDSVMCMVDGVKCKRATLEVFTLSYGEARRVGASA